MDHGREILKLTNPRVQECAEIKLIYIRGPY